MTCCCLIKMIRVAFPAAGTWARALSSSVWMSGNALATCWFSRGDFYSWLSKWFQLPSQQQVHEPAHWAPQSVWMSGSLFARSSKPAAAESYVQADWSTLAWHQFLYRVVLSVQSINSIKNWEAQLVKPKPHPLPVWVTPFTFSVIDFSFVPNINDAVGLDKVIEDII